MDYQHSDITYKGTYIIILDLDAEKEICVGRLGRMPFEKGFYAYVGSAFGPGGLAARIRHHIRPKKRRHWHLDYFTGSVLEVWVSKPNKRLEHRWAKQLNNAASGNVPGFGSSDCKCDSHLFYFKTMKQVNAFKRNMAGQISIQSPGNFI